MHVAARRGIDACCAASALRSARSIAACLYYTMCSRRCGPLQYVGCHCDVVCHDGAAPRTRRGGASWQRTGARGRSRDAVAGQPGAPQACAPRCYVPLRARSSAKHMSVLLPQGRTRFPKGIPAHEERNIGAAIRAALSPFRPSGIVCAAPTDSSRIAGTIGDAGVCICGLAIGGRRHPHCERRRSSARRSARADHPPGTLDQKVRIRRPDRAHPAA